MIEVPRYGRDEPAYAPKGGEPHTPKIRVVGVGGAGVNAVNRMVEAQIPGVEFMAVNTDLQSLQLCIADVTVHIGSEQTRGLGAGADPDLGYKSAFEEQDKIKRLLKGSDMVFVAAGAGGGTGTGAAPVVARLAREVGALTVGIVTKPFSFEGSRRGSQAGKGIDALAAEVDTLIIVPNDRLLDVLDQQTSMVEAFQVADDVLRQGVQGISDLVTLPALINLDFADVRTIMSEAGQALLGIGMGAGEERAVAAAEKAISSPLLETSMEGARSILLSITGGPDLSLVEVSEAAKVVGEAAHADANIIFGANVDGRPGRPGLGHRRRDPLRRQAVRRPGAAPSRRSAGPRTPTPVAVARGPASSAGSTFQSSSRGSRGKAKMKGVVAAGHPLTAEAGAGVLREGGNAVDAAVAAALTSFAVESPLTGLGAGGFMIVHRVGSRCCSTSSSRRRAGRATSAARNWSRSTSTSIRRRPRCSTSALPPAVSRGPRPAWPPRWRASGRCRWRP